MVTANNLKVVDLPTWLWKLPKLTWLALAGNDESGLNLGSGRDSSSGGSHDDGIPSVLWSDLLIQEKLGEGASGVIYKAIWSSSSPSSSSSSPSSSSSSSSSSSGVNPSILSATDTKVDGMGIGVQVGVAPGIETEKEPLIVAVKLFKGGKTSDGLPEDEMKAAQAAGGHPCSFRGKYMTLL